MVPPDVFIFLFKFQTNIEDEIAELEAESAVQCAQFDEEVSKRDK